MFVYTHPLFRAILFCWINTEPPNTLFHSVKANDIQHCTGRVMHFDCLSSNLAPPLRTLLLSGAAGESVMSEEGCRSSEHSVTDFYYLRLFATMLSMPHISRS